MSMFFFRHRVRLLTLDCLKQATPVFKPLCSSDSDTSDEEVEKVLPNISPKYVSQLTIF